MEDPIHTSAPYLYDRLTVGSCSICGGDVTVPKVYMSTIPPTPTCSKCGAVARSLLPVIDMVPSTPINYKLTITTGGTGSTN